MHRSVRSEVGYEEPQPAGSSEQFEKRGKHGEQRLPRIFMSSVQLFASLVDQQEDLVQVLEQLVKDSFALFGEAMELLYAAFGEPMCTQYYHEDIEASQLSQTAAQHYSASHVEEPRVLAQ